MSTFAIGMPGPFELAIIFLIVLILFGVGRLPQVFEALGKSVKSFRDAQRGEVEGDRAPTERKAEIEEAEEVSDRKE